MGSSSSTSDAPSSRRRKARARAIRWRWPADSRVPRSPSRVAYPSGSAATTSAASASATARSTASSSASGTPSRTLSATLASNRYGRCGSHAIRRRHSSTGRSAQVRPVHRDPPAVGVGEPQQHREQRRLARRRWCPVSSSVRPGGDHQVDAVQRRATVRSGWVRRTSVEPQLDAGRRARRRRRSGPAGRGRAARARRRPARRPPPPPCSRGTAPRPRAAAGRPPARGSARAARSPGRAARRAAGSRSATATSATDSVASSSSTSADRNAMRSVRIVASRCASVRPPDQRDLGLGPPEDRQRRQALDGVEEVPAEPVQQAPLLAGVVLRPASRPAP